MLRIAFRLLEINQLEECGQYARKVMELEPENYAGYYLMGRVFLYSADYPQAINLLEKSAALAPELATIQYSLYEAYHRTGRQEDAAKARDQFLRLDAFEKQKSGEVPAPVVSPVAPGGEKDER
jgi:tetratricopeptide (TPR) repeat protein